MLCGQDKNDFGWNVRWLRQGFLAICHFRHDKEEPINPWSGFDSLSDWLFPSIQWSRCSRDWGGRGAKSRKAI